MTAGFNIIIFYLNWYVLIPVFLARNRLLKYIGFVLVTRLRISLSKS